MPNYHKHWYGTLAQYNSLATKDSNTLYHCSEGLIYRGSVLLATRRWGDLSGVPSTFAPSAHTLGSHSDVNITSPAKGNILKYNGSKWVNNTLAQAGIATPTDISTAIDNIEIGGRNLFLQSKSFLNPWELRGSTRTLESDGSYSLNILNRWAKYARYTIDLALNSELTVSFYAKAASTVTLEIKNDSSDNYTLANLNINTTGWSRYTAKIKISPRSYTPSICFLTRQSVTTVYIKQVKLEYGNIATDWTPAPEDVDASIAAVQTNLNTHAALANNPHSVTKAQVGLGNVENTKLSTWAGSGSITALGTVVSGTWSASTISVTKGGTGKTSVGKDKMLYATANNAYGEVATTSFGRGLLSAVSGTEVSGLSAATATKLASITTTFTGTYPVTVNVNGTIYSHTGLTFTGSTKTLTATTFSGALTGNASSATILQTTRKINGVDFNGSANITVTANTPYTLTRGRYLTGSNFNGSANTTWAVDATSANTAGKVVARDSNGDFACRVVNAVSGRYSLKVVTGGHNYASQTYGVGIGTDGSNSGVIFYDGTGATGRIFREADVFRFIRGGLSYSGFDINADGSITVQGDMTTRTSLVVGSTNGTYVQIGSARLVYDQTNNAIKVVNADNSSCSLYATGSISAFGIGSSGGSSTSYSRLDDWADYVDGLTNDYVLSAELGYDLHTRVNSLNSFKSGTSWGGSGTGYHFLSIGGTSKALSLYGHYHPFSAITNKPTTLGGYGITNALPSTGGTLHNDVFNILELKRNSGLGASIKFSNNNEVLAKLGFDNGGSFIISRGTSPDGTTDMLYIHSHTKQITGYGGLKVSGNIESGTSDGSYIRAGHVKFLYDNSVVGIRLLKNAGGYAPFYAGSVYANEVQLTSSRSMKKDIMPFKNGLDLIKSIDVVSYLYKQDSDDDDRKIGFIADDTDSWLSGKSKTKYNIGNTVGALIKAVQELEKKNQELEQRLLSITNNN